MNLVHLKTFQTQIEAELAKGKLEANDIESMLVPEDAGGYVYAITRGDVGAKLMVNKEKINEAKKLLQT